MPTATHTSTIAVTDEPAALLDRLLTHVREEHQLELDRETDGTRSYEQGGMRIAFKAEATGLGISLSAPNASQLIFIKEAIANHLAEHDVEMAGNLRWTGETAIVGTMPDNFRVMRIVARRTVFDGLERITLHHPDVASFDPAQIQLRFMLPLDRAIEPKWPEMGANGAPIWPSGEYSLHARYLTIRTLRPEACEIDVDVVRHSDGLISTWASSAETGAEIGVMGPAGALVDTLPTPVVLAADGTGVGHLARLVEQLGTEGTGDVVIAAPTLADATAYLPETPLTVHHIAPGQFESEIVERVRDLTSAKPPAYAFFAGEFENAQALRQTFKRELGLGKTTQLSVAYWRRGFSGYGE